MSEETERMKKLGLNWIDFREDPNIPFTWLHFIQTEAEKSYFKELNEKLAAEIAAGKEIFPKMENWLRALQFVEPLNIKVVILGDEPYSDGKADGLAFSNKDSLFTMSPEEYLTKKPILSPSLENIFKLLKEDVGIENINGSLRSWAKQGVLLLNTILTVEKGKPFSHKDLGWEIFTANLIEQLTLHNKDCIFVLWGEKFRPNIKGEHLIIESSDNRPFSTIDAKLAELGNKEINWRT